MANKANNITGPGSSFYEIKHVRFWGLFTNEVLKMLENGRNGNFFDMVWFGNVKCKSLIGFRPTLR